MMSNGVLYNQPIVPECSATDGPVYLINEMEVTHDQVDVSTLHCKCLFHLNPPYPMLRTFMYTMCTVLSLCVFL